MSEHVADGWDAHVHVFEADAPVRAGHYQPRERRLAEIETLASQHGIRHLVLVQPSVYGSDNSVLLRALRDEPGRHRGVVVLDPAVGDDELDAMHAAGVRGIRFNLVSPVGESAPPVAALRRLAPALRERGWHVQWYVTPDQLPALQPLQTETGLSFVLDHLAGLHAKLPAADPAWAALAELAAAGAWIKLSGWYRLQSQAPHADLQPHLRRVDALFGARQVWGSDWPHTSFAPGQAPDYDSTWLPVAQSRNASAARLTRHDAPSTLYP